MPSDGDTSGLSACAFSSVSSGLRGEGGRVAEGPVHLRDHPEGQRVLHRGRGAGLHQVAALQRRPQLPARLHQTGERLAVGDHRQRDRRIAAGRLHRQRRDQSRRRRRARSARSSDERALADRHPVGRDQGQAVLRLQDQRRDARTGERLAAAQHLAAVLRAAGADRDLGDQRHRARGHRPRRRRCAAAAGCTPAFSRPTSDSATAGLAPDPPRVRPTSRTAIAARDTSVGQQRAEAAGVRHHDHVLLADELGVRHPDVPDVPDAGGQPVDGAAAGQHAVDDPPSGRDALQRAVGERDRRAPRRSSAGPSRGTGAMSISTVSMAGHRSARERLAIPVQRRYGRRPSSRLRRMGDSNSRGFYPNPLSKRAP